MTRQFTQKHYEAVAKVLAQCAPVQDERETSGHTTARCNQHEHTVLAFASMFEADAYQFNRTKFLNACEGHDTNAVSR